MNSKDKSAVNGSLEELAKAVAALGEREGHTLTQIASEVSNSSSMLTLLASNGVPLEVVGSLTYMFARTHTLCAQLANVQQADIIRVANIIDGYKKTVTEEIDKKV